MAGEYGYPPWERHRLGPRLVRLTVATRGHAGGGLTVYASSHRSPEIEAASLG